MIVSRSCFRTASDRSRCEIDIFLYLEKYFMNFTDQNMACDKQVEGKIPQYGNLLFRLHRSERGSSETKSAVDAAIAQRCGNRT